MDCAAEATMGYVAPVLTDTKVLETIMMVLRKAPNMRVFYQVVDHLIIDCEKDKLVNAKKTTRLRFFI